MYKKQILRIVGTIIGISGIIFSIQTMQKIHYTHHIAKENNTFMRNEKYKNHILSQHITLYTKYHNYKTMINLGEYASYFTIQGSYCDIKETFYEKIIQELSSMGIIKQANIQRNQETQNFEQGKGGTKLHIENISHNICGFIQGEGGSDHIELEIQNTTISPNTISKINTYIPVGQYKIKIYSKTPKESVRNTQTLLEKIGNKIIQPGSTVSLLQTLNNQGGKDLIESNIIDNGTIVQGKGGGSCLASTIIYRGLLDAGINIIQSKPHTIYYKNIYGIKEKGLDATIYHDDTYYIDLLFKNNYESPIILVPQYTADSIGITIYAKEKEYETTLTPKDTQQETKAERLYKKRRYKTQQETTETIRASYERIDNF